MLWGGGIVLRAWASGTVPDFSSGYAAGQGAGLAFGAALFLVGAYSLSRRSRER